MEMFILLADTEYWMKGTDRLISYEHEHTSMSEPGADDYNGL